MALFLATVEGWCHLATWEGPWGPLNGPLPSGPENKNFNFKGTFISFILEFVKLLHSFRTHNGHIWLVSFLTFCDLNAPCRVSKGTP